MGTSIETAEGSRCFQDAVSYAVGHRIRVEIISALHDLDSASAVELSRVVRQPLSTVTHHLAELLKAGSLRIDRTERVKSVDQHFYRLINPLFLSDEEMQALSEDERQEVCRVLLQGVTAEALAAFWTGDLPNDPRLFLCWDWFNVDERGRAEIAEEQVRSWRRIRQIEQESAARCEIAGEDPFSVVVTGLSYRRWRDAPAANNEHESW